MENSKNYELAFHADSTLQESEVAELKQGLENEITSKGGVISFSKDPEKTRLSYAINHKSFSYFGYIQFSSGPELIQELNESLKLNNKIFRYLVLKIESESQKRKQAAQNLKRQERIEKQARAKTQAQARKSETKDGKLDEKALEEIIEKL